MSTEDFFSNKDREGFSYVRLRPSERRIRIRARWFFLLVVLVTAGSLWLGSSKNFSQLEGFSPRSFSLTYENQRAYALVLVNAKEQGQLVFLTSNDRGAHFMPPKLVNLPSEEVISDHANPVRIVVQGQNIVGVYRVRGDFPGSGPLRVMVSFDGGSHWVTGIKPVAGDQLNNQSNPQLVFLSDGGLRLFWLDDREESGSSQGLRTAISHDGGLTWQGEKTVSEKVCTCCSLATIRMGDEGVGVLYRGNEPRDMQLSILDNKGAHRLSSTVGSYRWFFEGCPHVGGGLSFQDPGNGHSLLHAVVWTGHNSEKGLHYLRSDDQGATWAVDELIDPLGVNPEIATDNLGHVFLTYQKKVGAKTQLIVRISEDEGLHWNQAHILVSSDQKLTAPDLLADKQGVTLFWAEQPQNMAWHLTSHLASWTSFR